MVKGLNTATENILSRENTFPIHGQKNKVSKII